MSRVRDKVAIVSGAAQGLGVNFTEHLASAGAKVLAFDIQSSVIKRFSGLDNVTSMVADVSKRGDVEAVIEQALSLGGVDLLVNNAANWRKTPVESVWEQAVADWSTIMDTNLLGVLMLSRAAVPHMIARGGGDIVNVSTYYVLPARSAGTNGPDTDLYNASKWALNGFTDAWAKYLAPHNIRVNALCMGPTDTPMLHGLFPGGEYPSTLQDVVLSPDAIAEQMMALLADGRTGENIGAWMGRAVELGERAAPHQRITG